MSDVSSLARSAVRSANRDVSRGTVLSRMTSTTDGARYWSTLKSGKLAGVLNSRIEEVIGEMQMEQLTDVTDIMVIASAESSWLTDVMDVTVSYKASAETRTGSVTLTPCTLYCKVDLRR
jgi:hypothetical protein